MPQVEQLSHGFYTKDSEAESRRNLLIVAHSYQPHRETYLPSTDDRLMVAPFVNDLIHSQVYEPLFDLTENDSEGIEIRVPDGVYSFWAPLRDWEKAHKPDAYQRMKENINQLPDKEYKILGDTYLHVIMPLQTPDDQRMLTEIGLEAFENDLGFRPRGVWVAETAISNETMSILSEYYDYVVLRDIQIESTEKNPMYIPIRDNKGEVQKEMAVIHFDSGLSGNVSFKPEFTENADTFLNMMYELNKKDLTIGSDIELYGHHRAGREWWRRYITRPEVLASHGYQAFDVKEHLSDTDHLQTNLIDRTSWSCPHELGRWTGDCDCGEPSFDALQDKKEYYNKLTEYGLQLNSTLDSYDPEWRESFKKFFLGVRSSWFAPGNVQEQMQALANADHQLNILKDGTIKRLFEAKMCEFVGKTSCGWFFPDTDRIEREIPKNMITEIEQLVPEVNQTLIFQAA